MSNSYVLQTIATDIAIDTEPNLNVVLNANRNFEKSFVNDGGDTIKVRKPDFGLGLTQNLDVSGYDPSITQASIDLQILPYSQAVSWSLVEESLKNGNFDDMISKPRSQHAASDIQMNHLTKMFLGLGSAKVVASGGGKYEQIREIGSYIDVSRMGGDKLFACQPTLGAEIKNSGLGYFQASALDKTFENRSMGRVEEIEAMTTPDIGAITAGTKTLGSGTTMKVKTKVSTEGATSFTIYVSGGTATLTGNVAKGEPIYVTGINGVDVYGNDNGIPFPFVQQSAVSAGSNEIVVTCQPVYFTGPNKNVSVSSSTGIAADALVTFGLDSGATYKRGIAWLKPAVIFAARMLPKIASTESMNANTAKGLPFLLSKYGSGDTGINKLAWRIMCGSAVAYNQGVSGLFVKV